jgi:ribosomal protein L11 methyltransferase
VSAPPEAIAWSIELSEAQAEALAAALIEADGEAGFAALGVQLDDAGTLGGRDLAPGRARLTVYAAPAAAEAVHATLCAWRDALVGQGAALTRQEIAPADWNATWKAHFRALDVGARLRIEPPWDRHPPGPRAVVVIDPGMAFGTGSHETTRLAAEALERCLDDLVGAGAAAEAPRVLDVGTGSGLLALAAVRLGAASALGVDDDAVAIASAERNVALNDLQGRVALRTAASPEGWGQERYPLVVANIISSVLLRLRPALCQRTLPGGRLLLSGVLEAEREAFLAAFLGPELALRRSHQLGAWVAFELERRATPAGAEAASAAG